MPLLALATLRAGAAAAALAAAGLRAAIMPSVVAAPGPVSCQIVLERDGAARVLQARIAADRPVSGRYALRVDRTGPAGSAEIRQDGSFKAAPGAPAGIGRLELDGGGRLAARLDLTWDGGRTACRLDDPVEI